MGNLWVIDVRVIIPKNPWVEHDKTHGYTVTGTPYTHLSLDWWDRGVCCWKAWGPSDGNPWEGACGNQQKRWISILSCPYIFASEIKKPDLGKIEMHEFFLVKLMYYYITCSLNFDEWTINVT